MQLNSTASKWATVVIDAIECVLIRLEHLL